MRKRRRIPYLLVYYLVFCMVYSIIKHFAGWNAHTFPQLGGTENNFVGAMLAFLSEIILSLFIGMLLFMIVSTRVLGRFIIWATATVIPVAFIVLIAAHFTLGYINDKWAAETDKQLKAEIISRLPHNTFKKMSGRREDFTGYVTPDNDSLGLIIADTAGMARVYIYIDSAKVGAFDFDSCTVCYSALHKLLSSVVIPLQSFSSEEVGHNINLINNGQCYVADRNIYLGHCRKEGKRFIIINNVYDEVRKITCYEIGFQVDVKTPAARRLDLFE